MALHHFKNKFPDHLLYEIIRANNEVVCDLKKHTCESTQMLTLKKLTDEPFQYTLEFETDSKCVDVSASIESHNVDNEKRDCFFPGTEYFQFFSIKIPEGIPKKDSITLKIRYTRSIEVRRIDVFFDLSRMLVGLFQSYKSNCQEFIQRVTVKDSHEPVAFVEAMSSAKHVISNYGRLIEFQREQIPFKRLIPMTIVAERGKIKRAQDLYQMKWAVFGAVLGLILTLIATLCIGGK